jgi:hypothetical protein
MEKIGKAAHAGGAGGAGQTKNRQKGGLKMKKIDAVKNAFNVAKTEKDRLFVLAQAADNSGVDTADLGRFVEKIGGSADHLGALLLHRAAKKGLRPKNEIIK